MNTTVISQALPVPTKNPGIADMVGFGTKGVTVLRNSVNLQPTFAIADFGSDAGGWFVDKHVRLLGDTTGDKATDIVGFGTSGVWVAVNNGNNTFSPVKMVMGDFGITQGWTIDKHLRFVADLRKTGRVDLIGFGNGGIYVSLNNGSGGFGPMQLALNDFGYESGGWKLDRHLRFLADVTGDGFLDVVGFGENNVFVGSSNGNGTFQPARAVLNNLCIGAGGYQIDKHPRMVADLTGDGKADLLGFGESGVWVSLNDGKGSFAAAKEVVTGFCYKQGWRVDKHPRFIADLTGNKCGDIIGFGDDGVWVSYNNGNGTFKEPKLMLKDFGYSAGNWRMDKHPRFVVDMTGNGCADIIGFGDKGVQVSYNDGHSFGSAQKISNVMGYNNGEWAMDKTVRYVANLYE